MISASMISFLFGAVLSQRFSVLVLVPAMTIVMVLSVGAGFAHPDDTWWIVRTAVAVAVCLQCGYFAGIVMRHFLVARSSRGSSPLAGAETSTTHAAR
jgi:hypothetical protein